MDQVNIEDQIRSIISGRWIVETQSPDPKRHILVMRHPTQKEIQIVDFYKQKFIDENKTYLMSVSEATGKAIQHKVWLPHYDDYIDKIQANVTRLDEDVKLFKEQGKRIVAYKNRARIAEKELNRMSSKLSNLLNRKQSVFGNTLEYVSEKRRLYQLVGLVTEQLDGSPLWSGNIDEEQDSDLLDLLASSYLINLQNDTATIRRVARSNHWRFRWNVGKGNVESLFGRPIYDLSMPQQELLFWAQVYDSAIEAYEPPPNFVIDDDEKFDKWLEEKSHEREKDSVRKHYKLDDSSNNEHFKVIDGEYDKDGYWRPYDKEEKDRIADAIYGQNAPMIRSMQRVTKRRLNKTEGTPVEEQHLRRGYFKVLGWDKVKGQTV